MIQATNGIGVILEHRYYGTSFPTPDISTENLRFLTTEQALADQAYFSQNIKFPGLVSLRSYFPMPFGMSPKLLPIQSSRKMLICCDAWTNTLTGEHHSHQ